MSEEKKLPKFVHLRVHTSYSLSESAVRPEEVGKICAKNKMPAVAITDTNNLFGLLEISLGCKKSGVQLIPAVEAGFALTDDNDKVSDSPARYVIIAYNQAGVTNLFKLVSESFLNSDGTRKPVISYEKLVANKEGLIVLSGGYNGFLDTELRAGQKDNAEKLISNFVNDFGKNFYIELNRLGQDRQAATEIELLEFSQKYDVPVVATNNVMFTDREMHEAQEILLSISDGKVLGDNTRRRSFKHQYFKSAEEMADVFSDLPEALENTVKIAQRVHYLVDEAAPMLPSFPTTEGRTEAEELHAVAHAGLCKRLGLSKKPNAEQLEKYKEYFDRLEFEVGVINKMQFPGYFLIVSDFIRWAKDNNIPVGPGRGSGAGSVVAWAMEITNLDPIRFGLLFERFLNPERVSMPDFDIDFCQERRGEVINYVQKKYGRDKVAQIITFGKLQAKAVLRDVGRVMSIPYSKVDAISKMIPFNPVDPITLAKAIELDKNLQQERDRDEVVAKLLDIGLKLEGMHRHSSTHAAGVVIGGKPLVELLPLYTDHRSDMPTTQYSMKYCESASLVKFDFLGLKTLTLIKKTVDLIRENEGIEIDIDTLPFEDTKSYEMLAEGKGVGVFQMESAGMRDSMRKMKIDSIEDIIALISLYRPGPMENIPRYIACKLGKQKPDYLHPMLEGILKETHGVIIYQEQVMQIAQVMGGYTLGGADLLRRAMGKKIKAEMDAQEEIFVKGAVANGVNAEKASEIFEGVAKFAGYGFNKSHAAAYALIGFHTAYLKAHYPAEFLCSCMNQDIIDTDKILVFKEEARKMNIKILPPCINKSGAIFTVERLEDGTKAVRYALGALKNVGGDAMEKLVAERKAKGKFKNITDFINRVDSSVTNKRQLESLAQSGAFDDIHDNRRQIAEEATIITKFNNAVQEEKNTAQVSIFGFDENVIVNKDVKLAEYKDWEGLERTTKEFEALGFFLDNHPVDDFLCLLPKGKFNQISLLEETIPTSRVEEKPTAMVEKVAQIIAQ